MDKQNETPIAPVFTTITGYLLEKVTLTAEAKLCVEEAVASIVAEFDSFIRNGNRTDYRRDAEAFQSARVEPILEDGVVKEGKFAFTYSTMKGRRVDDVIYAALYHVASFIHPATPRKDLGADGKPKMQSNKAARERWIDSLGFSRVEVGKYNLKRTVFGDAWIDLKAYLEETLPERFDGTVQPTTAKQLLALVCPPKLESEVIRLNVYKPDAPEEKLALSVNTVTRFILEGYTFQTNKEGKFVGELGQYYGAKVVEKIEAIREAEAAKQEQQTPAEAAA